MTAERKPRGPYRKGVERRAQILHTALEVFAEHGERGASLKEIADRLGMSQAGLLHYFGSREELFVAVLAERDTVDSGAARASARTSGEAVAQTAAHNAKTPGLVELFVTLSAAAIDPAHPAHGFFTDRYADLEDSVTEGLRRGQEQGEVRQDLDARQLARLLLAVSDGLQVRWLLDSRVDMVAAIEVFNRLCAPPGTPGGASGTAD